MSPWLVTAIAIAAVVVFFWLAAELDAWHRRRRRDRDLGAIYKAKARDRDRGAW